MDYLAQGKKFHSMSKFAQAYQCYISAIKQDCGSKNAEAWYHIGVILRLEAKEKISKGAIIASIVCLKKAVFFQPSNNDFLLDLGLSYQDNKQWDLAEDNFRKSLAIKKEYGKAQYSLAYLLAMTNRLDEAEQCVDHAIRLEPTIPNCKWLKALIYLYRWDYSHGFEFYEVRKQLKESQWKSTCPEWNGDINKLVPGKILYIESEQGLGDTIQFSRFIQLIPPQINFICGVPDELLVLLKSSYPKVNFCSWHKPPPQTDYFCLIGSLPSLLDWERTPASLPKPQLYTTKNTPVVKPKNCKKTIGICWQGSKTHQDDRWRSSTIEVFYNNLTAVGIEVYSLQVRLDYKNVYPAYLGPLGLVQDLAPQIRNFEDTAAILKNLDWVVTIDSAVAHLAGSLAGRPGYEKLQVAVIIPAHTVDWRWGSDPTITSSPWYKNNFTLYRQGMDESWEFVLQRVRKDILESK